MGPFEAESIEHCCDIAGVRVWPSRQRSAAEATQVEADHRERLGERAEESAKNPGPLRAQTTSRPSEGWVCYADSRMADLRDWPGRVLLLRRGARGPSDGLLPVVWSGEARAGGQ